MLPRQGSTRGDSRRLERTTAWLEREEQQRVIAREDPRPVSGSGPESGDVATL